jgi:outer membrane protein assembly factor BamB
MPDKNKIGQLYKITLIVLALMASLLVLSGCSATRGAVARGWAGGVIEDGVLYMGSMAGNLVCVNATDGWLITAPIPLEEQEPTSGLLSCAAVSSTVAMYGSPVIADNLVCVGGYNGKVYAFSREEVRKEPRWVYPRQDTVGGNIISRVVYDQEKLYFGSTNNKVFCLDAADGFKEWEIDLPDKIWSTPAILNDTLYIGCFDKKLYALDTTDGSIKWEYETEGSIVSTPVISDGTVYFSSFDRNLYALDAVTGNLKWKFMTERWLWAKPVIYQDTLYAPCLDGKVYVFDASTGEKETEYNLEKPVSSSPVIINDLLIVTAQDGVIFRIDMNVNSLDELTVLEEEVYAPVIAGDGKVYIHTNLDALYEVDAKTGAKREIDIE